MRSKVHPFRMTNKEKIFFFYFLRFNYLQNRRKEDSFFNEYIVLKICILQKTLPCCISSDQSETFSESGKRKRRKLKWNEIWSSRSAWVYFFNFYFLSVSSSSSYFDFVWTWDITPFEFYLSSRETRDFMYRMH